MPVKFNLSDIRKPRSRLRRKDGDVLEIVPQYNIPIGLIVFLNMNLVQSDSTELECQKWINFIRYLSTFELSTLGELKYFNTFKVLLYLDEYYRRDSTSSSKRIAIKLLSTRYENCFKIKLRNLDKELCFLESGITVEIQKIGNRKPGVQRNLKKFSLTIIEVKYPYITVEADFNFQIQHEVNDEYYMNLEFSNWPLRVCHYALGKIQTHNILRFMSPFQKRISVVNPTSVHVTVWFDQNIKTNPEQVQAVQQIVNKTAYPSPYILFGPPGTGKTATIVEAVSQLYLSIRNNILICTPSNAAANEITKRLLQNKIPAEMIYRMTSPSADLKNVDSAVFLSMHFQGGKVSYLPMSIIKKKRIVISTLITCARLLRMVKFLSYFNYIFIDEAGQATEPETFIPFAMLKSHQCQIIMSGDPKQLGPVVLTKHGQHVLKTSLLERLMETSELYKKGNDGKYDANFITKLVKNYRSHKAILHLPNKMFYENELVACATKGIHSFENWIHLPKQGFPIIFHAAEGKEEKDKLHSGKNKVEARIVMEYVKKLLYDKVEGFKITEKNIGIVTPFKYQVETITKALAHKGWHEISVGTAESFQGQERDIIIVSTVRSTVFENEGKHHIGFLCDEKRFNVIITRARFLLIVIGNPDVLKVDDSWKLFIKFCQRNQACRGGIYSLQKDYDCLLTPFYQKPSDNEHKKAQSCLTLPDELLEKRIKALEIK